MSHEPRLTQALRALLSSQRVAALGTRTDDGQPFVSMVPFAVDLAAASIVIHVSGLAPHTTYLEHHPGVSLMVMQAEVHGMPVHALPRVTLEGTAVVLPHGSTAWASAREAYLARFPEAQPMTELGDFRFVTIQVAGARQVAGFGAARSLDTHDIAALLRPLP